VIQAQGGVRHFIGASCDLEHAPSSDPIDMPELRTTLSEESRPLLDAALPPVPGLVLIFANGRPQQRIFRWEGSPLELGRLELTEDDVGDPLISRKHGRFSFDGQIWRVTDLSSRNGTYVSGALILGEVPVPAGAMVRIGGAVLLPCTNILGFERHGLGVRDGVVSGPSLRQALHAIAQSAGCGLIRSLLISGESGSGKEIAARAFHEASGDSKEPFVALNCATVPKDLAERLLFGAHRGAFSGATDATGYVQAAHGGTLFLDEIAELPADVQTKLLRMLETREVVRLGATRPERVDVRICAATWRDLRQEVAARRFREDLYFRIGQPEIRLPPLRERYEELPWHIEQVLAEAGVGQVSVAASFVEACACRRWPGNVRELRAEVRRALAFALDKAAPCRLQAEDVGERAGTVIAVDERHGSAAVGTPTVVPEDEIANALELERGNVASAARRLGVHRNRVRRWLERHGLDADHFKPSVSALG
jgi:transcriptional regulator with AAA-type ATPase domain